MTGASPLDAWEEALAGREKVERLAQGRLGCGCPAEVFERITRRRVSDPNLPEVFEIEIGGRLLVHLAAADPADRAVVEALLERGRRWRDDRGLNRFRLVLIGPGDAPDVSTLLAGDDRLHLHVLPAL
jgi:hypothetical protein